MGDFEDITSKTATLYTITETLNERGDLTKATSATTVATCDIQIMSGDEREVRSGILKPEDAIGFFSTATTIAKGDEVNFNNINYLVIGLYKESLDTQGFQEVHLQKILS